jgi:pyruvate dehydrogenase E2 component (dihydrolipoamide acetyltransferase)
MHLKEVVLPEIGEGVLEGELLEWHISIGQTVQKDQPLVSILTDKATVEIAAPDGGILQACQAAPGETVAVGQVICLLMTAFPEKKDTSAAQGSPRLSEQAFQQAFTFVMPEIGEGVMEGEILEWAVAEGDTVKKDELLLQVLTDKATVELHAPQAARISKLHKKAGDMVAIGEALAELQVQDSLGTPPTERPVVESSATPVVPSSTEAAEAQLLEKPLASPAVRRRARALGLDLKKLVGGGPRGRVTMEDLERNGRPSNAQTEIEKAEPPRPLKEKPVLSEPSTIPVQRHSSGEPRREPIKGLRKAIFEQMSKSKRAIPHFTYVEEVEVEALWQMRQELNQESGTPPLSFLPFIIKAVVFSMEDFPILNASVDENTMEILYHPQRNIGIAAATPAGLMVPVLHDADKKSLPELQAELLALAERSRNRRATREDVSGGTFTITSLGKLGGLLATPIINHPEVAILGVHAIQERPVVRQGQVVVRRMMNLALSCDHRVVDGDVAAAFTQKIKYYLEQPSRLLLKLR